MMAELGTLACGLDGGTARDKDVVTEIEEARESPAEASKGQVGTYPGPDPEKGDQFSIFCPHFLMVLSCIAEPHNRHTWGWGLAQAPPPQGLLNLNLGSDLGQASGAPEVV